MQKFEGPTDQVQTPASSNRKKASLPIFSNRASKLPTPVPNDLEVVPAECSLKKPMTLRQRARTECTISLNVRKLDPLILLHYSVSSARVALPRPYRRHTNLSSTERQHVPPRLGHLSKRTLVCTCRDLAYNDLPPHSRQTSWVSNRPCELLPLKAGVRHTPLYVPVHVTRTDLPLKVL